MKLINDLLSRLPSLSDLLPATALIAIVLFITKECLEWFRRRAADARKVEALKKVLARECQLNYSAIDRLRDTLTEMRESGIAEDASRLSIENDPGGGYMYMIKDAGGTRHAGVLVGVQKDSVVKYLVDIAALDKSFYGKCVSALDGLSEADHVFQSLVHGPRKHFPSTAENYYDGLVEYGLRETTDSVAVLQELYFACTGSVLQ